MLLLAKLRKCTTEQFSLAAIYPDDLNLYFIQTKIQIALRFDAAAGAYQNGEFNREAAERDR